MESIQFMVTPFGSDLYKNSIILRDELLRKPLNLKFNEKDVEQDKKDIHIVGFYPNSPNKVICVCILSDKGSNIYKLRQVSVANGFQKQGLGTKMVRFAESTAKNMGGVKLMASSREYAKLFYKKLGYDIGTEVYEEVGIPHVKVSLKL